MDFERAMRIEHVSKAGYDVEFETSNYKIKTTPRREWEIIVDEKHDLARDAMQGHRRLPKIKMLCAEEPLVKDANLIRCEVIAVVLYTGPMVGLVETET